MVADISAKVDILRALTETKSLEQLVKEFPRLSELDIRAVLKQLRDDGFVCVLPPLPEITAVAGSENNQAGPGEVYALTGRLEDVERELYRRGIQSMSRGTIRQGELKKK